MEIIKITSVTKSFVEFIEANNFQLVIEYNEKFKDKYFVYLNGLNNKGKFVFGAAESISEALIQYIKSLEGTLYYDDITNTCRRVPQLSYRIDELTDIDKSFHNHNIG